MSENQIFLDKLLESNVEDFGQDGCDFRGELARHQLGLMTNSDHFLLIWGQSKETLNIFVLMPSKVVGFYKCKDIVCV